MLRCEKNLGGRSSYIPRSEKGESVVAEFFAKRDQEVI